MLSTTENPPVLYPAVARPGDLPGCWWVAHTLSRFEKAFARDLQRRKLGYFLPMVTRRSVSSGRRRVSELPLFPGYVFVCGPEDSKTDILRTNRLCSLLEVSRRDILVRRLDDIKRLLDSGCDIRPRAALMAGSRCRVSTGPLAGIEGIVDRKANDGRLVVNVDMLGQAAAVEIDMDLLESIEQQA